MKKTILFRTVRGTMVTMIAVSAASAVLSAAPVLAATKADDTVSITVNKVEGLDVNGPVKNTGETMDEFKYQDLLEGAGFTVYNVTQYFYDNYDGDNAETLYSELTTNWDSLKSNGVVVGDELTTDKYGKATFSSLPTKQDYNGVSRNAVYVIEETTHIKDMTPSLPLVVALPVYKADQVTVNTDIQLYPKNYGVDKVLLDSEGNALEEESKVYDYEVGSELTYQVKFAIPEEIGKTNSSGESFYQAFSVADKMSTVGGTFSGIKTMTIDGVDVLKTLGPGAANVEFTSTLDDASVASSWKLDYAITTEAMRTLLSQYAGKTMTITYNVTINENAVPDVKVNNDLIVTFDRDGTTIEQEDDGPNVTTGGIKFEKVDSNDTTATLAGAEFIVRNEGGQYAQLEGDAMNPTDITWVTSKDDATPIVTGNDGLVTLRGFEYGDYTLIETKAPTGYVDPVVPETAFTIKEGSYTVQKIAQIKNLKETKGRLPLTGGIGIITLLVIGGTMMGVSSMKKKED